MPLSFDILSQFAKITNDKKQTKKETFVYGILAPENDGDNKYYVYLDGDYKVDEAGKYIPNSGGHKIPVSQFTATVNPEEKVIVMIKNHSAIITGNISSQACGTSYVDEKFENIMSVDIEDIKALWNK